MVRTEEKMTENDQDRVTEKGHAQGHETERGLGQGHEQGQPAGKAREGGLKTGRRIKRKLLVI